MTTPTADLRPSPPDFPIAYVDDASSLEKLFAHLERAETVYLDLEADSMHHYYAKICLIQLLVEEQCYLFDPLSGIPLDGLLQRLATKTLVLHGADYDLRMLYQYNGFRPLKVFDTMPAAQLLGKPAVGLAALVQAYFGVALKKDQQKADWSMRPLPADMLHYGAQDTFFLPGLYATLTQELRDKNRLGWHEEYCRELIKATAKSKEVDLENTWRIDGSSRLYPRQLAALRILWKFREGVAESLDIPSYKILPADILLRFAYSMPDEGIPVEIPHLPSRLAPNIRTGFMKAWNEALDAPPDTWPQPVRVVRRPPPSPNAHLLAYLKQTRDKIAVDLGLDPSLLATRSTLTAAAMTGLASRQMVKEAVNWMKWQEELLLDAWCDYGKPSETAEASLKAPE